MALLLLLESSTEVCSVALSHEGKLIDLEEKQEGLNHSELLTSFVEILLLRNKIKASEVDAFAVSKGPGSYTGLRIGVSAAKGMCYATGRPLIAISSLDALGWHLRHNPEAYHLTLTPKTLLCPMIDARRNEVYCTLMDAEGTRVEPIAAKIITEDSFKQYVSTFEVILFGNGAAKCRKIVKNEKVKYAGPEKTSAAFMVGLAENKFKNKEFEEVAYFEPFYLKDFIATIPKNKVLKQKG
jgi:tRNA threonylcarbamoyladenosine biosynthesis protein TsaB